MSLRCGDFNHQFRLLLQARKTPRSSCFGSSEIGQNIPLEQKLELHDCRISMEKLQSRKMRFFKIASKA